MRPKKGFLSIASQDNLLGEKDTVSLPLQRGGREGSSPILLSLKEKPSLRNLGTHAVGAVRARGRGGSKVNLLGESRGGGGRSLSP